MTEPPAEETAVVPSNAAPEAAAVERPVNKVLACAVAAVLFCAFLGVDAITPSVLRGRDDWLPAILLGICIAQVNLIALWAAMAPGNIVVRISWSTLLIFRAIGFRLVRMPAVR